MRPKRRAWHKQLMDQFWRNSSQPHQYTWGIFRARNLDHLVRLHTFDLCILEEVSSWMCRPWSAASSATLESWIDGNNWLKNCDKQVRLVWKRDAVCLITQSIGSMIGENFDFLKLKALPWTLPWNWEGKCVRKELCQKCRYEMCWFC